MKGDNGWTEFFTGGNVGPDRVSRRASLFFFVTQQNVTHLFGEMSRHQKQKCHAMKKQKCHRVGWSFLHDFRTST